MFGRFRETLRREGNGGRPEFVSQMVLLLAAMGTAALCFMAIGVTDDVADASYRVIWLMLSSASFLMIYFVTRDRKAIKLRRVFLIVAMVVLQMGLMIGTNWICRALPLDISQGQVLLVLPYMLAPTVVSVMIGRCSGVFVAFCSSLMGLSLLPQGCSPAIQFNYLAISLLSGIASAYFSGRVHKREQILLAGLFASVVVYGAAFALLGIRGNALPAQEGLSFSSHGFHFGLLASEIAAVVGVNFVLAALIGGMMPALERLFNISTPITWLEWADMNHPILRKLQIAAPGTFHHSLVVQRLAEAAAEAVGADVTRAGVCGLYHDIGKTKAPQYFSENISDLSASPHNELTPEASVRIIIGHVAAGVELARQHHLNNRIIDAIREHHGVSTAYYFYRKAMDLCDEAKQRFEDGVADTCPEPVDVALFTYAGPVPQTRESGIVSMADAVESATRSLVHPTETDIRSMIDSIFKGRILDGHLQKCELTLGDIALIKESFFNTIKTMHHNRIAYPKPAEDAASTLAERRMDELGEEKKSKEA